MAKYITRIEGSIDEFTIFLENTLLREKHFAEKKHQFRTKVNDVQVCIQVFESYTFGGRNWLSINVTVLEYTGSLKVVVMTSGGSDGMLLKDISLGIDGEKNALEKIKQIIERYQPALLSKACNTKEEEL